MSTALFWLSFWTTATVSAYDAYLAIKLRAVLHEFEVNPVGRWLITVNNGEVTLFMAAKIIGTLLVLLAFLALLHYRRSWGVLVASSVAVFQVWLFWYLTWAWV